MPHLALKVANTFLRLARAAGEPVSPMKLQKLVYYAHGWNLGITDAALIDEGVEAWEYGPVVASVYHSFKNFGGDPIAAPGIVPEFTDGQLRFAYPEVDTDDASMPLIERVWEVYRGFSAIQLSNMTHAPDTPWYAIWMKRQNDLDRHLRIPDELISTTALHFF